MVFSHASLPELCPLRNYTKPMSMANELAALYTRDLTRVIQQVEAFSDSVALWATTPGMTNTAGNLVLHLEGNLLEYIGRQLGGFAYERRRPLEFSTTGLDASELVARMERVREVVPRVVRSLPDDALVAEYPERVLGHAMTTGQFLMHLNGHLNYHLGQIDAMRRALTGAGAGAIPLAGLD